MGQKFLLTKYITQVSVALNLCAYLLLKSEQSRNEEVDSALIQSHPVMSRLQKLYSLIQKLEDNVENRVQGIDNQLSNLAKAAVLMTTGHISDTSESSDDAFEDSSEEVSVKDDGENGLVDDNAHSDIDEGASQGSNKDVVDEEAIHCGVLNEARFGLRADELLEDQLKQRRRRQATSANAGEFNDETEAPPKSLASTLNSVEQRSASKKRNSQAMADGIDETQAEDDQLRRGIEMMEAEFGKDFDKVGEGDDDDSEDVDPELDDDDFYSRVASASKSRKDKRKQKYEVAPKYPRLEGVVEGERGISKQIMKNRGLVAHKNKLNRNPRVKKREQYRKAVIRRKGAVRDVRTDEGHKYDGEGTGIKSNVSRSRKLAR
jgi:U3 small nucleolar RNA-associated protein 3